MIPMDPLLEDTLRCYNVISEGGEEKFIEYMECAEYYIKLASSLQVEVQRLQEQSMKLQNENGTLQNKLKNAKLLYDLERKKRTESEDKNEEMLCQIQLAFQVLSKNNNVDETKEKLQILSNTFAQGGTGDRRSLREALSPSNYLSTINEDRGDTLGSILSVSDINLTEDELECSQLRSGKAYKGDTSNNISGHKRKSSDRGNRSGHRRKSRKSSCSKDTEMNLRVKDNGVISEITAKVNLKPSAPPAESTDDEQWNTRRRRAPLPPITPQRTGMMTSQPSSQLKITPTSQSYSTPLRSPMRNNYSTTKLNQRQHTYHSKTIYKVENCQPCGSKIRFGKLALKCKDCRATCHPECKEAVPLPCIPTELTPGKNHSHSIADFTPKIPPMVPALVVHCTNEVEQRGLTEVGIYRVPGSEKEVKDLKHQFLRGKGVPNLSNLDINVVCGTMKDFLKSLKEPLITLSQWTDFVSAANKDEPQDAIASLYQAISELPQPNRDTLSWIILHLQKVGDCPECKMPPSNLARVFGPTIVGYSSTDPDPARMLEETRHQYKVMEKLLEISGDYWSNFLHVEEVPVISNTPATPEGGTLLGILNGPRRGSFLVKTPLISRESMTPRFRRSKHAN